jgi:hypothetical protein
MREKKEEKETFLKRKEEKKKERRVLEIRERDKKTKINDRANFFRDTKIRR